ncbi:MAG: c-type cytochrome [Alphaproteobacteria bacterium]|nr:c-type cytochrome [Alphaproteobacteria bacterium]
MPVDGALGGDTTRAIATIKAFTFPAANMRKERTRAFFFGNRIFNTNWVEAPTSVKTFDGLGPVFNRVSCSGCHTQDGRGRPPENPGDAFDSMLFRLSQPGSAPKGGPLPDPVYGDQLGDRALPRLRPEGRAVITYREIAGEYADETPFALQEPAYAIAQWSHGTPADTLMISPRVAPQVIGMGLIDAIPDETLLALADPEDRDADGISGRVNTVWNEETGKPDIGRYGWKANVATLEQQDAGAAFGDIGLTSRLHRKQNCPPAQEACLAAIEGGDPELSDELLEKLVLYTALLAVPAQRNPDDPEVRKGGELFLSMQCAACHRPTMQTGPDAAFPELANQTFHPFSDFLLHDMGMGLADGRPDFDATGSEWRTPPLWGVGLFETVNGHTRYLHDGRARNLSEAILWHGGEAQAAREAFRAAPKDDREALIAFLNSL